MRLQSGVALYPANGGRVARSRHPAAELRPNCEARTLSVWWHVSGPCKILHVLPTTAFSRKPVTSSHARLAWTMRYGRSASVMTRRSVVSSLARISSRTRGVSSDGPAASVDASMGFGTANRELD